MQQVFFLSVLILTVAVGCSTNSKYVRSEIESKIGKVRPYYKEKDIQKNLEKKVNLPKPFSMAVYFQSPKNSHSTKAAWRWSLKDKELFVKKMRESLAPNLVSQVFLMEEPTDDLDLYEVRLAASKFGADSVLIVQASADISRQPTRWVSSYALVLPTLFVNGNKAKSYFTINASLWDVRNEMLYLSTNAEGELTENYPIAWSKPDSEYLEKTKELALLSLIQDIPEDFSSFKAQDPRQ